MTTPPRISGGRCGSTTTGSTSCCGLLEEFHEGTGKAKKRRIIFPRFHQWDAVKRAEADALANGPGQSYLLQHSTGSGKSNSIAWLAHRLSVLHDAADKKIFDKVVVVTDRRVLDEQLSATVSQFESVSGTIVMVQGKKGSKSKELADALKGQAKIITVTLETFPFVIELIADADLATKSYAVIVDEAHSSQTGDAAAALKQALGAGSDGEGNRPARARRGRTASSAAKTCWPASWPTEGSRRT